ncbi:organic cation/carnitine transporter 4-like [Magnolia sinica]|uniref:organic cation/carnitine transporter 4-like n=1 Tax=Magnolia sinica TaxID=86752 RepID=UPI002658A486|nr:organic cation/carnitine transporter 4-like [Magnolia sinica]
MAVEPASAILDLSSALLTKKSDDGEKIGIDEMLQRFLGDFGHWQMRHFVLTSLAWALEAFHTMVMIFADREPAWRCTAPGGGPGCGGVVDPRTVCDLKPGTWEWIGGPGVSTVAEWGLVCGEKYKVGLAQSAFFAGCMVGAGVFGHLSDSFLGRKGSLTIVSVMNLIFGCLTAISPTYWIYTLLRFLTGLSTGGVGLCAFVLATEPVGPSKRGLVGMSAFYFFSGGIAVLAAMAYVFQSWRQLYIIASIPSLLFLIMAIPFISESPRWYLVHGNVSKAMKVMHAIAERNGTHLPDGVSLALDDASSQKCDDPTNEVSTSSSLIDVVRLPLTRSRLILIVIINFLTSVVYYGLSLNAVNLGTNLYINVALNAVAEMPAFALTAWLLDVFGRKPLTIGTMWFSGVFCIAGSLIVSAGSLKTVRAACGILGIFGMAGTYNLLFIYAAELFPTVVRNAALGCATQAGQMGAILSPLVVVLGGGVPFMVFGVCGIVGGLLAFYLPETLNRPLYDTMAGMEVGEIVK